MMMMDGYWLPGAADKRKTGQWRRPIQKHKRKPIQGLETYITGCRFDTINYMTLVSRTNNTYLMKIQLSNNRNPQPHRHHLFRLRHQLHQINQVHHRTLKDRLKEVEEKHLKVEAPAKLATSLANVLRAVQDRLVAFLPLGIFSGLLRKAPLWLNNRPKTPELVYEIPTHTEDFSNTALTALTATPDDEHLRGSTLTGYDQEGKGSTRKSTVTCGAPFFP